MTDERVHWIVDRLLLERYEDRGRIDEAIAAAGHVAHVTSYVPIRRHFDPFPAGIPNDAPVLFYGTLEGLRCARRLSRDFAWWQPLAYCREENLSYAAFSPHFGDLLLNDDFIILPVGEIARRCRKDVRGFLDQFGGQCFIRPNSVTKSFGARILTPGNAAMELSSLNQVEAVAADELAVVCRVREIEAEYRCVIADRKVVGSSKYHSRGGLDISPGAPDDVLEMAERVAAVEWQPDVVYVCDIGIWRDQVGIVEFNSFSCAGLYACDLVSVVEAVSDCAAAEYHGD